jgi:uncharacterized iron-regulated membrane protein
MGDFFGLANQLLLAALAIGLITVIIWGYRMWWQRRPTRNGNRALVGAPPVGPGGLAASAHLGHRPRRPGHPPGCR